MLFIEWSFIPNCSLWAARYVFKVTRSLFQTFLISKEKKRVFEFQELIVLQLFKITIGRRESLGSPQLCSFLLKLFKKSLE